MGKVILICGKIGSGKTTYANKLAKKVNAVIFNHEDLLFEIFGTERTEIQRTKFCEYSIRCSEYIASKAMESAKAGATVIYDSDFWSRSYRDKLRKFCNDMEILCELHYIDTSEEQRFINIQERNEAIKCGKSTQLFTHEDDINHFFEIPGDDEIDFRIKND